VRVRGCCASTSPRSRPLRGSGEAEVSGAELGSKQLVFRQEQVRGGEYHFSIGSAGSACLVVQTVLLPLLLAEQRSLLVAEGGTHNLAAPPWDYLA
jgi:RNA 3'-terminal phosphate cyclase (ATP)